MPRPRTPPENPFRIGGVVTGDFFADRADERRSIHRALTEPQAHLLVYGPRRVGKTSTLRVVQEELAAEGQPVILADLSTVSTVADMTTRLLQSAAQAMGRQWSDAMGLLVQRLQVKVSLETERATGLLLPSLDVSLRDADLETQRQTFARTLDGLDELARVKRTHLGIILDEFQEIHRFGADSAEAHLRGVIQHHRHVSYVLAGSDERLIGAMLGKRRALYGMLDRLEMGPIAPTYLARWIEDRMTGAGVRPSAAAGDEIVALAGPRTRDIVRLARVTFELGRSPGKADAEIVHDGFRQIVVEEDAPHRALWVSCSPLQQQVLRAVAERSEGLTTAEMRKRHALPSSGAATKAALTLVERDLLVRGAPGYYYDSPYFRGWVVLNALPDLGLRLPATHLPRAGRLEGEPGGATAPLRERR